MSLPESKTCSKCGETKALAGWSKHRNRHDGLSVWCKDCMSEYRKEWCQRPEVKERLAKRAAEKWASKSAHEKAESIRRTSELRREKGYHLKKYGLDTEGYKAILAQQGGVCAICSEPNKRAKLYPVDHDHACCPGDESCGNCIRGILCFTCNVRLGVIESPWLERANEYLRDNRMTKISRLEEEGDK